MKIEKVTRWGYRKLYRKKGRLQWKGQKPSTAALDLCDIWSSLPLV